MPTRRSRRSASVPPRSSRGGARCDHDGTRLRPSQPVAPEAGPRPLLRGCEIVAFGAGQARLAHALNKALEPLVQHTGVIVHTPTVAGEHPSKRVALGETRK